MRSAGGALLGEGLENSFGAFPSATRRTLHPLLQALGSETRQVFRLSFGSFRHDRGEPSVIAVHLRYEIDPEKVAEFREYGQRWIRLVPKFGGTHLGYFLPSEGDNDEAFAVFTFPSLAAYEEYRARAATDAECAEAYDFAVRTKCIRRYERRFLEALLG